MKKLKILKLSPDSRYLQKLALKATILNGWPSQSKKLPPELHEYFKVKDELAR